MKQLLSLLIVVILFGCGENMKIETVEKAEDAITEVAHPWADKASYQSAPEVLKNWVDARAGTGEPVHWVADGAVYEYPSGKKLFGMIGFDSSTIIWPDEADGKVTHLTRKTFAYTDPETGEVLTEYNGQPVTPIAYPYQMITYRLENDRIYGDVEQGVGERVQVIKSEDGIPYRKMGSSYIYNAQVYLDFPLPGGRQYQAWENYDFFIHPEGSVDEPHQMAWERYGALPPWAGMPDKKAVIQLHSWRVESHDEFPEKLLTWAKKDKPKWLNPPKDIAEVRALQKGEAGAGWGR
ncbi:DUF1838 domain-containing protein [Maribacter algarum]|uniref:DUF1838 domain-containing protein n=1 Tax=Maribacter algarum (ex Zhang et al. 2020) TaxID=2578118 RepID=A0A5S3PWN4_9FLAO|nr:DUF1838 family protein [Maribacter algarum]TMM58642.1 DUF1838 domain-containing protein [Maribacter algarum]